MNEISAADVKIRPATVIDLDAINSVIEVAVMSWALPERVKRLSLSSYRYSDQDLKHFELVVAEDGQHIIHGVAAWEQADSKDSPAGHSAVLLHGIYVQPSHHHRGIGHQLFRAAEAAVCERRSDGLLVKAQKDADGFFISEGMTRLQADNPVRDYANRFWKRIDTE